MIVPIIGNVTYSITLDPTVWIFDDRKIEFDKAFTGSIDIPVEENVSEEADKRWNRAINKEHIKPPVNKSISKFEGEKILKGTYVMPIEDFVNHAEAKTNAKTATLIVENGVDVTISLEELRNAYLLFAVDGKPVKKNGPVHFYHKDGSNKDNPIESVNKIVVN
ncbi:hypothetical protein [Virgibacillus sp. DJP39]|uniref:hypothetical protein n=1 Tax=Virgibacillus sp. DJP39 TaxID=3409790 RepID=UPI003BB77505